jgi:retron-type reverse transcriptase
MRRHGGLWPRIASFDNLCRAAQRAARGKKKVAGVARFLERLEPEALSLLRELEEGSYRPGRAFAFVIRDPKERTITAASFRDRVVHHALIDPLEPLFDRRMVFESFACRRGKGTHAALAHARRCVRRRAWFLKLDIRSFFPSIDHPVVMETLGRILKDRRVLDLCQVIVTSGGSTGRPRVGLPIGNLTSQWFANLVLDRLDHFVKEGLRIRGYVRYMDDFVLFGERKEALSEALRTVGAFLTETLHLCLKDRATILAPSWQGLPFLGFRIHPGTTRLRPGNLRRTRSRLRTRLWQYRQGILTEEKLGDCVRSVACHLDHGSTLGLRRRLFAPVPAARSPPG